MGMKKEVMTEKGVERIIVRRLYFFKTSHCHKK
jgi:hypothetical protein